MIFVSKQRPNHNSDKLWGVEWLWIQEQSFKIQAEYTGKTFCCSLLLFSTPQKEKRKKKSLSKGSYVISQLPNKDIERPVMHLLLCISPAALCNPLSLLIASTTHWCNSRVFFLIHKGFGNTEPLCAFSAHDLNPSWSGSWRHQPLNVNAAQCARWLVVHRAAYSAFKSFSASWNGFITVKQVVTM